MTRPPSIRPALPGRTCNCAFTLLAYYLLPPLHTDHAPTHTDRPHTHPDGSPPHTDGLLTQKQAFSMRYLARLLASLKTSYASWIFLNFSSPSWPGFRSGWYFSAAARYAFLISDSLAPLSKPSKAYKSPPPAPPPCSNNSEASTHLNEPLRLPSWSPASVAARTSVVLSRFRGSACGERVQ